jgi:hypothetical protein
MCEATPYKKTSILSCALKLHGVHREKINQCLLEQVQFVKLNLDALQRSFLCNFHFCGFVLIDLIKVVKKLVSK